MFLNMYFNFSNKIIKCNLAIQNTIFTTGFIDDSCLQFCNASKHLTPFLFLRKFRYDVLWEIPRDKYNSWNSFKKSQTTFNLFETGVSRAATEVYLVFITFSLVITI